MNAIEINGISKSYGAVKALDGITLSVHKAELFGLIGPDGAGKTTLFRILTTLLNPDCGTASVAGLDVRQQYRDIRNVVGYMPSRFSLYPDLSVSENLDFLQLCSEWMCGQIMNSSHQSTIKSLRSPDVGQVNSPEA